MIWIEAISADLLKKFTDKSYRMTYSHQLHLETQNSPLLDFLVIGNLLNRWEHIADHEHQTT